MAFIPDPVVSHDEPTVPSRVSEIGLFQDVPKWIWTSFLSAWTLLFGLFIVFFTTNSAAAFVVTIAVLFVLMAFGLPMALAAQSKCQDYECMGIIHTHTGPLTVGAAAAQILLVPVGAVIGLIAFITLAM
jgi:hypothetical protein